ncbi:hypothetical protein BVI2075_720021 [Burkholderia vietnamiensis]|nr:hypothetical protein BVI2075_720021 [Burkholderia vietnamiensis]
MSWTPRQPGRNKTGPEHGPGCWSLTLSGSADRKFRSNRGLFSAQTIKPRAADAGRGREHGRKSRRAAVAARRVSRSAA